MHYIVALTGGIGSGKSTVANYFTALGVPLIDADVIARQMVYPNTPALRAIINYFGLNMLHTDGTLNRIKLREQIFNTPEDKFWLNNLLHPLIQKQTEQQFHSFNTPYVIWVIPLLIEKNLQRCANRILVVDVETNVQIKRALTRDSTSEKQIENIIEAQALRKHRLAYADDIIDNNGHPEEIMNRVVTLHYRYLKLAKLTI